MVLTETHRPSDTRSGPPRRVAIYEPDPRICGPGTWAANLRRGFRELGHECDVVTFTKSGKSRTRWGRVEREVGMSNSCSLVPDVCAKLDDSGELLDTYDLVIMPDVKTPGHDKQAEKSGDAPEYLEVLRSTRTKWTSALHERWYWDEWEQPEGKSRASGSPFISELLGLENFSEFLITHCRDFDRYCARLQRVPQALSHLPFVPCDAMTREQYECKVPLHVAAIGRVVPTKHRHLYNEMCLQGLPDRLRGLSLVYGGGCSATHGPSHSFELWEQLVGRPAEVLPGDGTTPTPYENDRGWDGTRLGGVCNTNRWRCWNDECSIEYYGAYESPSEVLGKCLAHLAITDCDFSGGLAEFSTLEAISNLCVPIVTRPFVPHAQPDEIQWVVIEREFAGMSLKRLEQSGLKYEILGEIASCIASALDIASYDLAMHNWNCVQRQNDPRRVANLFLQGTGLD